MYPHHVFDLEPAGTFGMYPICYWRVSGRYFQPESAMYSRCFCWFPGPLAPSGSNARLYRPSVGGDPSPEEPGGGSQGFVWSSTNHSSVLPKYYSWTGGDRCKVDRVSYQVGEVGLSLSRSFVVAGSTLTGGEGAWKPMKTS